MLLVNAVGQYGKEAQKAASFPNKPLTPCAIY